MINILTNKKASLCSEAAVLMILMMGELELCSRITQEETIVRSHQMLRQPNNKQDNQHYQHLAHYYSFIIKASVLIMRTQVQGATRFWKHREIRGILSYTHYL